MAHLLNSFFDKIFLISIKRNRARLDFFLKEFPDIDIEVFEGVDGQALFPSIEYVAHFPTIFFEENQLLYERCKFWNKGQLGCAMSNLFVQKEILKRKLKKVLILEDDSTLVLSSIPFFLRAITELPKNWDLFYLGYNAPTKWGEYPFSRFFVKIKHSIMPVNTDGLLSRTRGKRYFATSYSRNLKIPGVYAGTHAYALSYEGAKKIVAIDTPLQHGYDTTLMYANYNKLIRGFALKKPLFVPNSRFETSLTG